MPQQPVTPQGLYPGANRTDRYWPNGGGVMQAKLTKLVLHSTETTGLPSYGNGSTAPTLTIDPLKKKVWQHFRDVRVSAKALRDTGGFAENRDNVAQIEIIGYSDPAQKASPYFLPNIKPDAMDFIAEVVAWFCVGGDGGHEVPVNIPIRPWLAYPASYGNTIARMSTAEYDAYTGILGHLHVPQSTHGDVTLDIQALLHAVKEKLTEQEDEEIDVSNLPTLKRGDTGMDVKRMQGLLLANGFDLGKWGIDGVFGPTTEKAVIAFHKKYPLSGKGGVWSTGSWKKSLGLYV